MTIRVHESWEAPVTTLIYSGEGEDKGVLEYEITNCATSAEAYTALLAGNGDDWLGIPGEIDGLLLRTIDMRPDGPMGWKATANYGEPKLVSRELEKLPNVGDYRVSFSAKPATVKQYFAKSTTRYPAGAPDFGGAINVNRDGKVDGVDVIIPSLSVVVTQRMAGAALTPTYALAVANLVGKYNNAGFLGFPAGSLQFTAGDGSLSFSIENPVSGGDPIDPQDRELSFEFLYSPNLSGLTIGDITGINKLGHQYMWILWKDDVDGSVVVQKPRAVYVQDLYGVEPASFAPLALTV
ncbi:hypothetical protein SH501x_001390 [Pirellulaceae bacterium SH501]|jgi:hypothetical protein